MATIAQLEKKVKELEARVSVLEGDDYEEQEPAVKSTKKSSEKPVEIENLGFKIFGGMGFFLILLSLFFGYSYAVDQGYIGIKARVAFGIIFSVVVMASGEIFRRKSYEKFGQLVIGGGISLLYFTVYAMYFFEEYRMALGMSLPLDLTLLFIIIAGAVWLGIKINSRLLTIFAFALGYVSSIIAHGSGSAQMLLSALIISAIFSMVMTWKKWGHAIYSLGPAYIVVLIYYMLNGRKLVSSYEDGMFGIIYLMLFFALYQVLSMVLQDDEQNVQDALLVVISSVLTIFLILPIMYGQFENTKGVFVICLALIHGVLALVTKPRDNKTLYYTHGSLAVVYLLTFVPVQLDGSYVAVVWAVLGLLLFFSGIRLDSIGVRILGYSALSLAFFRSLLVDTWALDVGFRTLSFGVVTSALFATGIVLSVAQTESKDSIKQAVSTIIFVMGSLMILFAGWVEVMDKEGILSSLPEDARAVMLSVIWAVMAIAFIVSGIAWKITSLRLVGTILFGLTIGKVLLIDLGTLNTLSRSLVTIIVGILALGGSFAYVKNQDKIKKLLER